MNKNIYIIKKGKFGDETYVKDPKLGGYTVFFKDFPNIMAEGKTIKEAHECLWNTTYDVLKHLIKSTKKEFCLKSPTGKHEYTVSSDSFEQPYCKYCYKGS
jgi:hypothetical protein